MGQHFQKLPNVITLLRIVLILIFTTIAFQPISPFFKAAVIGLAAVLDLMDGYVARLLGAESDLGAVLDLVADKSLTVISCLYLAVSGYDFLPLTIISVREIVMLGMRTLRNDKNQQVLATSKIFGGLMAGWLWMCTIGQILRIEHRESVICVSLFLIATIFMINLILRVYQRWSVLGRL